MPVDSDTQWRELAPFDSTHSAFHSYARAIAAMIRGEHRLWLGAHDRPRLIGALTRAKAQQCDDANTTDAADTAGPCAGCTCSLARAAIAEPDPADIALVVPTSGSTGAPKSVAHSLQSLKSSIHATAHYLGGHGAWIPLLPPTHIAGIQVIARATLTSDLLGFEDYDGLPAALGPVPDLSESFGPHTLRAALAAFDARGPLAEIRESHTLPLFTSLVPTQLERLVSAAEDETATGGPAHLRHTALDLRRFTAILVGGAAISPSLVQRARALGAHIVTTYGSSETAGGCVYNGEPLRGVELKVGDDDRLMITSPSLALGYVYETGAFVNLTGNDEATRARFFRMPELATTRLFLTSDLAHLTADPATGTTRVQILGRSDDVIISGGRKIVPQAVEQAIADSGEFAQCVVVGVDDPEWGQQAVALVVPRVQGIHPTGTWRANLGITLTIATAITAAGLDRYAIPRHTLTIAGIPLLASGKVDRAAAATLASEALDAIAEVDAATRTATRLENDTTHLSVNRGVENPNDNEDTV